MRIKTFQGRSLEELLPQIREELGPDAVVLGQRAKVQGGVAGFFGTRVIEVTAADRMPDDEQLVDLEDQLVNGDLVASSSRTTISAGSEDLEDRFRGAMRMGRVGGLDVTDEWDPSEDAELAQEYGRVLEHAAAAGFSELDLPTVPEHEERVVATNELDVAEQAHLLAARAHAHLQETAARVEQALPTTAPTNGTYAPPAPLPRPAAPATQTFAASIHDSPAIFDAPAVASQIVDPLREDLGLGPAPVVPVQPALVKPATAPIEDPDDPIAAALDLIDLRAIEALRTAVDASRRIEESHTSVSDGRPALRQVLDVLAETGVDTEVVAEIAHRVAHHRLPFEQDGAAHVDDLVRDVAGELIDTRSGFERSSSSHTLAVVGASSSGKTTVLAQLAHAYRSAGMRVGVVVVLSADPSAPIVQDPRLVSLGADLRYVSTPEQAANTLQSFAAHDLVLVDTPGSIRASSEDVGHVRAIFDALEVDDVHVVVPLATSGREAGAVVERFRSLGANRVIVSRINETEYVGQLLNLGFCLGMPMSFLSDDSQIPTGLTPASTREIVDRIVPSDIARAAAMSTPKDSAS